MTVLPRQLGLLSSIGRFFSQRRLEYNSLQSASIKNRFPPALLLGGHSVSDPPDPISNSAVKPDCADGTVAQAPEE
jgi:hypothetical protein